MTSITDLICEYRTDPIGIDVLKPRLGWQMQTDRLGARQTAYRIFAASDPERLDTETADRWDSGKVESDQSVHIVYAGSPLASRQRVHWKVLAWDETGSVTQSSPALFEMGLLKRKDWKAKWIGTALAGGPRSTVPTPYMRRTFRLPGAARSARLYITALGLYECSINGQVVGEDVLNPGWTNYNKRVQYKVYDVTNLLCDGENVLGATLGDGWAVGRVGMGHRQNYSDRPLLLAQLEVTVADGRTITVTTDRSWKYHFGPILDNDLLDGESYDARREMPGWDAPNFDDKRWLRVQVFDNPVIALVATNGPTVRRISELKPISDPVEKGGFITKRLIFDLGQNMVGRIRLKGSAPAGTTVVLRFAEALNSDGTLYTANLRGARVADHYTFKGENEEIWEPKFTFHGFRYVEVAGYPGTTSSDTITGIVLHSEMTPTGEFECSDPLLNQLQHNIIWSQKGNFVDIPIDCPQRDERLGWTGDIQVFGRTAAFNMDVAGFLTKWAQDVADAQTERGSIPAVVPNILPNLDDGGPAWAEAVIICPWTLYLCYGDQRILENNYPVMTKFMEFLVNSSVGYIRCAPEYEGWQGFGDWLSINADTPRDLIGTAFLVYAANLMAQIAAILGKSHDVNRYRKLAGDAKASFGRRYLKGSKVFVVATPQSDLRKMMDRADSISRGKLQPVDYGPIASQVFNTNLFTPTQTAYVLALHFDLLPEHLRPLAVAELVADIERRDIHLSTGFVGAPHLPHVLSNNGRLDIAYALLNQKTWPSWLYAVVQGATTIWERWDGWTEGSGFQDPGMNSFNHYAYGSIGAWLYNTVAGIEIDPKLPGYKHAILCPRPGGNLTHACGKLKTLYGELTSQWELEDDRFEWTVIVPPNTTATLYVPVSGTPKITLNGKPATGSVHTVAAGQYHLVVI